MTGLHPQSNNGLHWVRGELEATLMRARTALEQHLETPEDAQLLRTVAEELHVVRGTLSMIQCYGAALFAAEMTLLLETLQGSEPGAQEESFSTLSGATLQLSDYLDMLGHGEPDRAMVLQTALNELRVARGQPLFSEAELFAAQAQAHNLALTLPRTATPPTAGAAQAQAKHDLVAFQNAFLQWFRGVGSADALARMGRIADGVADTLVVPGLRTMWLCYAALAENLRGSASVDSLDLKRLFGRAGSQLKQLADAGEDAAAAQAGDTAYLLLFRISRAPRQSERGRWLLDQLEIADALPSAAQLDALRRRMRGPGSSILQRVYAEIRSDFSVIKDRIDLAVRTSGRAPLDQTNTSDRLKRLATTLSALGLPAPQQALANQARILDSGAPDALTWMEVATAILRVEQSLEEALFRTVGGHGHADERPYAQIEVEVPHAQDLRSSIKVLVRESLVDFAQIKTAVDQFLKDGDAAALADVPRLLHEVASGLHVLGQERGAGLVFELERYVAGGALERTQIGYFRHERFADAVACVEVFLEALRDSLPSPERIVDNLAYYMGRLDFADVTAPAATAPDEIAAAAPAAVETLVAAAAPPVAAPMAAAEAEEAIDPEIRDIFIEEAGEVLLELRRHLPLFRRDPGNREALSNIRRAFHTLKGSGRMVGALRIGEFGWALEHMLNRCLEGALPIRSPVFEVVGDAIDQLPGLIENFCGTGSEPEPVGTLIARATALAEGQVEAPEPDMRAVFCDDARERLATVQRWLDEQEPGFEDYDVDAATVRAFHTLKGSAAVVNAVAVSRVSAAIEGYLNMLRLHGQRLSPAGLTLLGEAVPALRQWVDDLAADVLIDDDASEPWQARIQALAAPAESGVAVSVAALPAVNPELAMAVLDDLQTLERQARAWAETPAESGAIKLHEGFTRIAERAAASGCAPLAVLPSAIAARLAAWRAVSEVPGSGFFAALQGLFEDLYQQLDRYREGALEPEAAPAPEWLLRVEALSQPGSSPGLPEPVASAGALDDERFLSDQDRGFDQPAAAVTEPPADPELLEIFSAEAGEILVTLHHYLGVWSRDPGDGEALTELRRGLHTLKGSARTARRDAMGQVAEHLDALLEGPVESARAARLQAQLEAGFAGLQQQLDGLRRGSILAAEPILAAIDAAASRGLIDDGIDHGIDLDETLSAEAISVAPADEPVPEVILTNDPVEDSGVERPPGTGSSAPPAEASEIFAGYDVELGDIFAAEATELLETLDSGFEDWRNGDTGLPVLEIQRALHTLKGGARMAGIETMGEAAHELESAVNTVLASNEFPDAATFTRLRAQLEILQRMHDQIRRGQAQLLAPPLPDDALGAPSPKPAPVASSQWAPELFWKPEDETGGFSAARREMARVPVDTLDAMLNEAGEISIYRSRLEEHNAALRIQLHEMVQTISRIREQLRMMDIETEAQIAARGLAGTPERVSDRYAQDFDPLEMDRYSRMQELSRALAESSNDLSSLQTTMDEAVSSAEALLLQQSRINTEVQQGLMGTLMVPFSRQVQRLLRVVRQTAQENGKQADLQFIGAEAELDRNVLERMTAPLEHLLRNAVVHGIEAPETRARAGKPDVGVIQVQLNREGSQLLVEVSDDGAGLDFSAIRRKAIERGMITADAELSDDALARFIFEPGFSTASRLTQDAGRGIGMDVVASEVKQLGGTLELRSELGVGTRFLVRLPLTLAVSQALLVGVGQETYAVPLPSIEGVGRISRSELADYYREDGPLYRYGERGYRVRYLGDYLDLPRPLDGDARTLTVILVGLGEGLTAQTERRVALVVDHLLGNREIISKAAGPQISAVAGVTGATILADGRVVLILDIPALVIETARRALLAEAFSHVEPKVVESRETIMVVDDSITMRRVAERLLLRHGYRVVTAKDGLDAIALLQTEQPDVVLLDIEMPRADGFEVAAFIRNNERLSAVPIVMITSRSGEKHRERARSLGVNRYLIKPYQEEQLLVEVNAVRGRSS